MRELNKDEQKAKENSREIIQNLKNELADVETKLDKLLSAYLDEIVSAEEYSTQKQKMLDQRVELKEKIGEIENKGVSWLEPARAWVKSLNQAEKLLSSGDKSEMKTFLKQIGSNHILIDKSFSFSPKNEYKFAAERSEAASSGLKNSNWRRRWDSNPRATFDRHGLASRYLEPLGHSSLDSQHNTMRIAFPAE